MIYNDGSNRDPIIFDTLLYKSDNLQLSLSPKTYKINPNTGVAVKNVAFWDDLSYTNIFKGGYNIRISLINFIFIMLVLVIIIVIIVITLRNSLMNQYGIIYDK